MNRLRTPLFLVGAAAMLLAVLLEIGASLLLGGHDVTGALLAQAADLDVALPGRPPDAEVTAPPGRAIPYLALVDGVVLFTVGLMAAGLVLPHRLHGRAQGVVTIGFAIMLILTALVLLVVAIVELITMVALFFAFPFGTIAYLIIWGSFPRGEATALLSVLMFLKFVFAGALVLAQPRFVQNKGLVLLVVVSLVCNVVAGFLHGLVPGILVSITDDLAAIVFAVVAIVLAVVLLVGAIPALVRTVQTIREARAAAAPPVRARATR
jgi:hypothetical protein